MSFFCVCDHTTWLASTSFAGVSSFANACLEWSLSDGWWLDSHLISPDAAPEDWLLVCLLSLSPSDDLVHTEIHRVAGLGVAGSKPSASPRYRASIWKTLLGGEYFHVDQNICPSLMGLRPGFRCVYLIKMLETAFSWGCLWCEPI